MAKDVPNKLPPGMDMNDMPSGYDKERMDECISIKQTANEKFKEGDYFSAKCMYAGALEVLERCCLHLEKADETWEGIKNNIALCDLKRQEWSRVVDTTTEILTRNTSNTKALYRRGVAHIGQGKLQEAQRDLKAVVEVDPGNVDARSKLSEIMQQSRLKKSLDKEQAEKMRGFLRGERLDDTVAITEDGDVRKLHGNENAPLFSAWFKRSWLSQNSGVGALVTAHIVLKTQAGKEIFNTRKPPGTFAQQQGGPHMMNQPRAAQRPSEPARWVIDDAWEVVFKAWNSAAKSLQMHELGKFEVARHTLGPSVEGTIERCMEKWLGDTPARREMFRDVPPEIQLGARRKQALQILCLPEEFCLEPTADPNTVLNMEMELLEVHEYVDIDGDGRNLLRVIREGKKRSEDVSTVGDLSAVALHYRISKLLLNYTVIDTRMGLANTSDGLVMRQDKMKEPMDFFVGEEEAADEGDFVPPCIGRCLMVPPGGVVEGMQFELVLRDGVPISDMDKKIHDAYANGTCDTLPDTTGPVVIRIDVEKVVPPIAGPSRPGWQGVKSIEQERLRAEELEHVDEGKHKHKALKRWKRIITWLEQVLGGRRWKLQGGTAAGDSMYDLEWEDDEGDEAGGGGACDKRAPVEAPRCGSPAQKAPGPEMLEVEDELLQQLQPDELCEWATAHVAIAAILDAAGDAGLSRRHARSAVQASKVGRIPKSVEIRGRSLFGKGLLELGEAAEALEVIRVAQALDPTSSLIKDQLARATRKDGENKSLNLREALRSMRQHINDKLEADDVPGLQQLLEDVDGFDLAWDAVNDSGVGKEIGKCAKHSDPTVADPAKAIVGKFHKLAKQHRPLWGR